MTAIIDAQMYGPGSAWGARSGIPTHAPVHPVQASSDDSPVAVCSRLRISSQVQLAGLRAPSFSHSRLRGGLSSLPVLRIGRVCVPSLRTSGHPIRSRFAGCHRPGRVRRCPGIGCHFKAPQHAVQSLADVPKSHSVQCLSVCGSYANQHTREALEIVQKSFGEIRNV